MLSERIENSNYDYQIVSGKDFNDYGIEEQAAMVQDRFRLQRGLGHWRPNSSTLQELNTTIPF